MVMRIKEKVAARDEADEGALGGGGGGLGTPGGVGVPEEAAVTLTANFCPPEQCCPMVQMK